MGTETMQPEPFEDHLACGAYDARRWRYIANPENEPRPESPAVDAGSDDAYGYDSTSTNPKVIDMGQPDIGYHYYRRVADDDPVNDQLIEFTFQQPKVDSSDSIDRYVVPHPIYQYQELHFILPDDQMAGDEVLQEGFLGKNVVLGNIKGRAIPEGDYSLDLKTEIGDQQSVPASVRLIIDPDPPTIQIGE